MEYLNNKNDIEYFTLKDIIDDYDLTDEEDILK